MNHEILKNYAGPFSDALLHTAMALTCKDERLLDIINALMYADMRKMIMK